MMSKNMYSLGARVVGVLALLAAAALAPRAASADGDTPQASVSGITFGGRASYFRPKGADSGSLWGGAQLRWHIIPVVSIEVSEDYRQNQFGGTTVDETPIQASLLLYLAPAWVVSPYILGGGGYYYTHVEGRSGTKNRYGPHAGAGLEAALSRHWSIDGSYRYLWTQSLTAPTTTSPAGKNFSDHGFILTAALNYRF
jgi:opacity protein-like surface antigen